MAETVLRRLVEKVGLGGRVEVGSAGTGPWHVGEDPDPRAVRALERRGYPPPAATARQFRPSWFAEQDLILALDTGHASELRAMAPDAEAAARVHLLRSFDGRARGHLDIPDPYYSGQAAFDRCLAVIERACLGVVDVLRRELEEG
jgi:protein-tyrosine phosphatase